MTDSKTIDWDDAYDNVGHITNAQNYPGKWAGLANTYRDNAGFAQIDIPYGMHEREQIDLFLPDQKPAGLIVFIHGGYWLRFDKSYWSHLAEGARQNGWAVAIPSYVLAPEIRISEITQQITEAITVAASMVEGPIHIAGHSAGGHLATRMINQDTMLAQDIVTRIKHILSISGLHDLRPLLKTRMNANLNLTETEAKNESSSLKQAISGIPVHCWVGSDERPEFIRQSHLLADSWNNRKPKVLVTLDKNHHHFSVIEQLADKNSTITKALLGSNS